MSRIAITGSTGLIGTTLRAHLESQGHEVVPVVRGPSSNPAAHWDPATGWFREGALEGVDAVVHLAGASIGDGRWTPSRKKLLVDSRVNGTRLLVSHLATLSAKPPVLVSASAVGYYGRRGEEVLDESAKPGTGFLPDLVVRWEEEALKARDLGIRVVLPRFGVLIAKEGGALPKMLFPFKMGVGGNLGSGKHWMAWIHKDDAAAAVIHAISTPAIEGPINVVAEPVRNAEFTKALGKALKRPTLFPVPPIALNVLFGRGTAEELLMASQRVSPRRLIDSGFQHRHPEIAEAIRAALA
jgi:uncharacterized protein (TIGR01777 family)